MDKKKKEKKYEDIYIIKTLKENLAKRFAKEKENEKDLTLNKFAVEIDKNYRTVQALLDPNNEKTPDFDTILSICNRFQCDIDSLFGVIDASNHTSDYICKYTGLSEETVKYLNEAPPWVPEMLDYLCSTERLLCLIFEYAAIGKYSLFARGKHKKNDTDSSEKPFSVNNITELEVSNYHVDHNVVRRSILDSIKDELDEMAKLVTENKLKF